MCNHISNQHLAISRYLGIQTKYPALPSNAALNELDTSKLTAFTRRNQYVSALHGSGLMQKNISSFSSTYQSTSLSSTPPAAMAVPTPTGISTYHTKPYPTIDVISAAGKVVLITGGGSRLVVSHSYNILSPKGDVLL